MGQVIDFKTAKKDRDEPMHREQEFVKAWKTKKREDEYSEFLKELRELAKESPN